MKKHTLLTAILAASVLMVGCNKSDKTEAADASATKTKTVKSKVVNEKSSEEQKISYILGYEQGLQLKQQAEQMNEKIDTTVFGKAIADAYTGKESALTDEQIEAVGKAFEERKAKEALEKAAKNKADGEKFLAENAKKQGVKTTESGLQYKVIKEGQGASPKATDSVVVHYEGKLLDGKVFDSSYEREMPVQFALNEVVKGWSEGVQLMKPGAKYELYIPAELAYGEKGNAGIEPNSTLIFTVELLSEAQIKAEMAKLEQAQKAAQAQAQAAQAQPAQSAQPAQADAQKSGK